METTFEWGVESISWAERKCDELIAKIKRSKFAADCFADARYFHSLGYVMDVALSMAWCYWGC